MATRRLMWMEPFFVGTMSCYGVRALMSVRRKAASS